MKRLLLSLALASLITGAAAAADMRMPMKAPPPALAAPMTIWSGFYIGAMGGYAAQDDATINGVDIGMDGGFVGGTVGYNWQSGQWVFGIEADGAWADINASETALGVTVTSRINALGTVRGRLGVAFDTVLLYATGGYAWMNNEVDITIPVLAVAASDDQWHHGYAVGAGIEWMFAPKWSFKAEYLFRDFGSETYFAGIIPPGVQSGRAQFHSGQIGVNFHF